MTEPKRAPDEPGVQVHTDAAGVLHIRATRGTAPEAIARAIVGSPAPSPTKTITR